MLYKFPAENESCKEYVVSLRSFLLAKKSLKFLINKFESFDLPGTARAEYLNVERFNEFIEQVLFNRLRNPQVPLPQNVDEIMNTSLKTFFQEYIYAQYSWQVKVN